MRLPTYFFFSLPLIVYPKIYVSNPLYVLSLIVQLLIIQVPQSVSEQLSELLYDEGLFELVNELE